MSATGVSFLFPKVKAGTLVKSLYGYKTTLDEGRRSEEFKVDLRFDEERIPKRTKKEMRCNCIRTGS